ncbi:hypothetical protein [Microbulbifer sp. YPW1]|nr:hypothetical protein [Microbulbifer sp. YPW1]QKX16069.1 hypothetical protein HUW35_03135 [Microbulbifer sp. YPW1]
MQESVKNWWSTMAPRERNALTVLGLIFAGIQIFAAGIWVGRVAASFM